MTMMNHHDARGPEETMPNLPPVVPAGSASRSPTTGLQASRNARPPAGRRRKRVGAAGTRATPSPGGLTSARRRAPQPPEPLRLPAPLNQLPWEFAKDQFGAQGADFIGVMGALILRTAKDQFGPYPVDPTRLPGTLPPSPQKTSPRLRAY